MINLLENSTNQPTKFSSKNWGEINDDARGYSDAHILVSGAIKNPNTGTASNPNDRKSIIVNNCVPFTDCINEINNTQIDNAKDTDIVMAMHSLIEYSGNYSKASGYFWRYYRDEPFLNANSVIADFLDNNSASFKFETKKVDITRNDGTVNVNIMVPFKYLSQYWRTFEIRLINCETNFIVTCSANWFTMHAPVNNQVSTFAITDPKGYAPIVTLSTQNNEKLLQQLKSGFKRTINWNKDQSKVIVQEQNRYLDWFIDPIFRGVNRLFVLSFE